jgi:hypothetical protein
MELPAGLDPWKVAQLSSSCGNKENIFAQSGFDGVAAVAEAFHKRPPPERKYGKSKTPLQPGPRAVEESDTEGSGLSADTEPVVKRARVGRPGSTASKRALQSKDTIITPKRKYGKSRTPLQPGPRAVEEPHTEGSGLSAGTEPVAKCARGRRPGSTTSKRALQRKDTTIRNLRTRIQALQTTNQELQRKLEKTSIGTACQLTAKSVEVQTVQCQAAEGALRRTGRARRTEGPEKEIPV